MKLTVADTTAPLVHFRKNGYYVVGDKIFNHKILALQYATETNLPVRWNFNNEVFGALNWQDKSSVPLPELYRLRAVQLRNKYKYLVLCWSGGGDSTNMLEAFLHNHIPLDEVVVGWPYSLSNGKYKPNNVDKSAGNFLSEWDYTIKPQLEQLKKNYPSLKITVIDQMCKLNKHEYADDTLLIAEKHNYVHIQRNRDFDKLFRERTEKHDDVAILFGTSATSTKIIDGYLYVQFVDSHTTPYSKSDYTSQGWVRNIEFFYWTPDMPEIVKQQAHVILDYINTNSKAIVNIPQVINNTTYYGNFEMYRQFCKFLFYPNYFLNTFQVVKQEDTHNLGEYHAWFHQNPEAKEYLDPWRSAVQTHQALIASKFFKTCGTQIIGYVPFTSPLYKIGKVNEIS